MIPTSSIVVPIYEIICKLGLYDTKLALIIVYAAINMPFVMWTMLSFYEGIPRTLDEAAYVDGASSLQTFRKVILPICAPGLATAFIFTLFLALLTLWMWDKSNLKKPIKVLIVIGMCFLSMLGDWPILDIVWPLYLFIYRDDEKQK